MIVRWVEQDIVELITNHGPGICLVVTHDQEYIFELRWADQMEMEAFAAKLTSIFINHDRTSVLIVQPEKEFKKIKNYCGYWVLRTVEEEEILLDYHDIPYSYLKEQFREQGLI